jgi:hypothetical protein
MTGYEPTLRNQNSFFCMTQRLLNIINNLFYLIITISIKILSLLQGSNDDIPTSLVSPDQLHHLQAKRSFLVTKREILECQIAAIDASIHQFHNTSTIDQVNQPLTASHNISSIASHTPSVTTPLTPCRQRNRRRSRTTEPSLLCGSGGGRGSGAGCTQAA